MRLTRWIKSLWSPAIYLCNKCGYCGVLREHPGCGYYAYLIRRKGRLAR
jgi:hypothetical protein